MRFPAGRIVFRLYQKSSIYARQITNHALETYSLLPVDTAVSNTPIVIAKQTRTIKQSIINRIASCTVPYKATQLTCIHANPIEIQTPSGPSFGSRSRDCDCSRLHRRLAIATTPHARLNLSKTIARIVHLPQIWIQIWPTSRTTSI